MKILILNYEYPPVGGGGGRVSEQIANRLSASGHDVRVITSHCKGLSHSEIRDKVFIKRVVAFRRRPDACGIFSMAGFLVMGFVPALTVCWKWKPDIIHAHFAVPTGALACAVSFFTGIPYLLTAHLGDVPGCIPEQTDRLFRYILPFTFPVWKRAKAVTAVSDYVKSMALKTYNLPIRVIPNGIDLKKSAVERGKSADGQVKIVFCGRFSPQKNIHLLCEILRGVQNYDWSMHFIGDGPLLDEAKEIICKLGLTKKTEFHGWVHPARAEQIMACCDILLIPSVTEGMPVVVLNALALGLAVIGSDIPPLRELVLQGENGFLCSLSSKECFRDKLIMLLSDRKCLEKLKTNSRASVRKFDWDKITIKYETLMKDIAKG
ncbi:MAG: glycosyltransferase family 4 protein [Chitinispirillaceae bacterium]